MTVGIITKIGKNYGALLQAYALKRACEKLGADAHIIRYTPQNSQRSYKICRFPWGRRGAKANIQALMHYWDNKQSSNRFLDFREKYFDFIGSYSSFEEINERPPECDIYISGSDQVWNPQISYDDAFYLSFVKDTSKMKASYAASIGLKKLPDKVVDSFSEKVKSFHYVSVRERQAQKILQDLDIPSVVAPDPTLLFDQNEWNSVAAETVQGPYILCYFVSYPVGIEKIVHQVKEKYGYTVVNLMTSEESSKIGDIQIRNAGPQEFLGLFKNASFVITSSFHGTVFSVINRKKFVSTLYNATSSRVEELLGVLGLKNRITAPDALLSEAYYEDDIYSEKVEERIQALQNAGMQALKDILSCTATSNATAVMPEPVKPDRISCNIKSECTGCGACGCVCPTKAISYTYDKEGFLVPQIDEIRCIHCGKCVASCHLQNQSREVKPCIGQYAAKLKNLDKRMHSRSGGAFAAISDVILSRGGAVYGAVMDSDFTVYHRAAYTAEDRDAMCGSKYVQSDTCGVYETIAQDLKAGREVLFCGTPCQVAAVSRIFDRKKYSGLFLCDFVCHGVPSPGFWMDYVNWLEKKYKAPVDEIEFRDKQDHSWESHVERIKIGGKNHYSRRYTNVFYSNTCLRDSCFSCEYTTAERVSDITIGDYWGIDDVAPEFNDHKGISLVMLRTEKAAALFEQCKHELDVIDTSSHELVHYNLKRPTARPADRDRFWHDYEVRGFGYATAKYGRYDFVHRIKYRLFDHME